MSLHECYLFKGLFHLRTRTPLMLDKDLDATPQISRAEKNSLMAGAVSK